MAQSLLPFNPYYLFIHSDPNRTSLGLCSVTNRQLTTSVWFWERHFPLLFRCEGLPELCDQTRRGAVATWHRPFQRPTLLSQFCSGNECIKEHESQVQLVSLYCNRLYNVFIICIFFTFISFRFGVEPTDPSRLWIHSKWTFTVQASSGMYPLTIKTGGWVSRHISHRT
jgi:hypothetical protein